MAKPLVFSFIDEQRRFLFLLLGFLTFLTIVSSGIILSLSNAVGRFSSNLEKTGIIMVMPGGNMDAAVKIIGENKNEIAAAKTIDKDAAAKMLSNYLNGTDALTNYIPTVIQVRAKETKTLDKIAKAATDKKLRFTYARNAATDRMVGIKIMLIATFIFITILCALTVCILHSVRNIITIHKREIEILRQIGSTDGYIAAQIQRAMLNISARGIGAGFVTGGLVLLLINGLSRQSSVGLLANMGLSGLDWLLLFILSILLIVAITIITRHWAMKILDN